VVVTASRDARAVAEVPASVSVVTAEDIAKAADVSLPDALRDLAGIEVRSFSGNASQAEVRMRGFGENAHGRVLVLLDGQRLNRPDMAGINWLQVPLNSVERIEVIRGGNSVLYGDYALGGVINIITKKGSKEFEFENTAMAGSYGTFVERAGASGSRGPLEYSVNAEAQTTDGYRDRSAYRGAGAGAGVQYDVSEKLSASVGLSYDATKFEMPGYLTLDQMKADPRQSINPDDDVESDFFNCSLGLRAAAGAAGRADVGVSYGRKTMRSDVTSWMSFADQTIDTLEVTPRYVMEKDVFGRKNRLVAGVDFSHDLLNVDRFADKDHGAETSSARLTETIAGVYARDEVSLNASWIVSGGARLERNELDARTWAGGAETLDGDTTHNAGAIDVGVVRKIGDASKVFGKLATVYRYPFVDEQVSYIGYGSDQIYTDIEPEKGEDYELGAEFSVSRDLDLAVTLFLLNMRDEIAWNNMTMRNENLDETRRQGAEVGAQYALRRGMTLGANYTYTAAEFTGGENDGHSVPLVPKHMGSAWLDSALPWDFSLKTSAAYVGSQYLGGDNGNLGPRLSDYTVVNLLLRYNPSLLPAFSFYAGVDNLFDEEYASVAYKGFETDAYYPSPGRSYKAGVSCRF
jgi:iron complex outermembrane receptor protein